MLLEVNTDDRRFGIRLRRPDTGTFPALHIESPWMKGRIALVTLISYRSKAPNGFEGSRSCHPGPDASRKPGQL